MAFFYEEQDIPTTPITHTVLVRIAIAKVKDVERLRNIVRHIKIDSRDEAFNCYAWVKEAYLRIMEDGKSVKSYLGAEDWVAVEACARKYCKRKRDAGRFQAELTQGLERSIGEKVSTFNYWENRETVA